jgi:hypothetical protein
MQPEPVRSGRLLFPAQEFTMRDMTPQDKMLSVMGGRKPLALPEGRGTKNTFIDNKYNEQYNNIEDIKKQLAKYYSGFKDGGIDDAAKAISDLEETERRITGDYLQNNPAEAPNGLRGHPNRIQNKPYKTVGLSFSRELIDTGKVNLTGFKFNDVKELATVAQVFRDPRFETFRIIYTNGSEVVGTDALTSRLPGSATAFLGDIKRYLQKNIERMKRIGADGYYLLHNHPSGKNVKPSQDDVNLTYTYAKNLPGFRGHVIINSNKYTEIYTDTTLGDIRLAGRENLPLDLGEDLLLTPSVTHDLIGKQVSSSSQLASAAKTLQTDNDISAVVFTNSAGEVTGIQEVSNSMIRNSNNNNFRNFLRRQAMEHGGRHAFIVGDQSVAKELQSLVESNDLTDAIIKNTGRNLRTDNFVPRGDTWMGLDVIKQGRRAPLPKPFKNQPLQFKTQIPPSALNKIPKSPEPLQFKQTIEVPKVYDKHAFTGETRPLSKLDQLMMKENAGTNQVMARGRAIAAMRDNSTVTVTGRSVEPLPKPSSTPETIIPDGLKERGVSRNVRTDANRPDEIRESLSQKPFTYEQISNKETLAKAENIMGQGVEKARTELDRLINEMNPEAAPLAKMIADNLTSAGNIEGAREVLSNAAVKATQAGQFGQAFRILRQADSASVLSTMDKLLRDLNEKGAKRYGKKWVNVDLLPEEKLMIGGIKQGDEQAIDSVFEQIGNRIAKSGIIPTTNMEKFDAWRRVAMLFNPKTHIRNIVGNVIMMGMRKSSDTVAAGIEAAVNAFRKSKGLAPIQRTKAVGWSKNKAIVDATEKVWEANKKDLLQVGRWDIENFRFLNREKRIFDTGWLENLSELSKQGLNAGDAPFVKRAYKDALGQFMTAQNLTTATDEAMEYAKRRAFEATFKQANELSKIIQGLKSKGGVAGTLVEGAIPFVRTPANILMRGLEYSPAGLMKTLFSKGKAPTEIIEGLAKGMTGTGIAALGFLLADMGWAKYERSKSKNVEAILQQMGEQANSIITPQGSYTFDWAQPFAIPLAMGIAAHEALEKNNESALEAAKEAILAGGDTLFAQGMLRNIRDIMGGAYGSTTEAILSVPVSYVEQAFPTVFGQVARAVDPIRRSTYDTSDIGTFARGIGAKLPFASKKLEPRLDVFGREQKQDSALHQFLNPGYWKAKTDDPVTKEIVRLYRATGDTSILPKVAPTAGFSRDGAKYKFTPEQLTQFQRETGQRNYTQIKAWLSSNRDATDDQKVRALKMIVRNTDEEIKNKFAKKMRPLK